MAIPEIKSNKYKNINVTNLRIISRERRATRKVKRECWTD
jgi:hypothetical protein